MSESSVLGLPKLFQPYQVILLWISTIYGALYVMVNNHYVFKPKVQHFFEGSAIHSTALYQFLVDVLTNLTHLTFLICSLLFLNDDNALSVMIYSDISWVGLFLCLIAFKALSPKEEPNYRLFLLKNVIFLCLVYAVIGGHYATNLYYISLGIFLVFLYGINILTNGYDDKFVAAMEMLFGYKPTGQIEEDYNHCSNMPSLEYLSQRFQVTKTDIHEHIRNQYPKLKTIQLKTRRAIVENLLKISLAVHLSKQKMEMKAKRDVKYYYGTFNGTVIDKSKKMILDKPRSYEEDGSQADLTQEHTQEDFQTHNSALFYVFPVKFLEGNQTISVLFSIAINLGLGILLSVALKMTETIRYGQYFQIIFGVILLPILPSISKEQFLNSMVLSSLWKYCLYGIFITIVCLSSDSMTSFSFTANVQLVFTPFIQLITLILGSVFVFSKSSSPYSYSFLWMGALFIISVLIFKYC